MVSIDYFWISFSYEIFLSGFSIPFDDTFILWAWEYGLLCYLDSSDAFCMAFVTNNIAIVNPYRTVKICFVVKELMFAL